MRRSRIAFFVAFWFVALSGALFYAGINPAAREGGISGSQMVIARLLTDGPTLLAWLIAAFGMGGLVLSLIFPRDLPAADRSQGPDSAGEPSALLRFVSSLSIGLGVISLLTLGLGLAGWLNHASSLAIIIVGILLTLMGPLRSEMSRGEVLKWLRQPALWNWLWICTAPFMAMAIIASLLPPGILWRVGDPSFYDVVEYHLQIPREWFELGRIVPLHHNVFSFFPLNVEMHYLLAMHLTGGPWAGMYLAQLMHLAFVALFVLAVYAVALQIASPLPAMIAGLAVATVPWLTQLGPVAYDEGGFLLFSTLAIGWVWQAVSREQHRYRSLVIAGAFAGFACGVKLTAVPEVLALLGFATVALLLHQTRGNRWIAVRGALIFGAVGLLAFSPWLVRNQVWAGSPVFPEAMRELGPGEFNAAQVQRWEQAHSARPDQRNFPTRARAAWREIFSSWQYGCVLFPLAAIGIACGISSESRRAQTALFAGMFLAVLLFWMFATHLEGRFFVLAIPICGLLIAQIKNSCISTGALIAVMIGGTFSGLHLHHHITATLRGGDNSPLGFPAVGVLGIPDLSMLEANMLDGLAPGQQVVLIGDAKAFFYTIPMSQLHYRTVFDVREVNGDIVSAWNNGPIPKGARVIIDPAELERFHRTYANIPAVPDWIERDAPRTPHGQPLPFVMNETR